MNTRRPSARKRAVVRQTNSRQSAQTGSSISRFVAAAERNELVVVIGAGVSIALTNGKAPSWRGLIEDGFAYGARKGRIQETQIKRWKSQLTSNDLDELLKAALFKIVRDAERQTKAKSSEDIHEASEDDAMEAFLVVAFHARNVWSDVKIAKSLMKLRDGGAMGYEPRLAKLLREMGIAGKPYLQRLKRSATEPKPVPRHA